MRRRAVLGAMLSGAALAAGCDRAPGGAPTVRIPLGAGGVGFLPLLAMRAHGLIERQAAGLGIDGLRVQWIDLGGPAVMNDALLSGAVDFIAAGPPAFLTLWDRTRGTGGVKGLAALASLPMYLNTRAAHLHALEDLRAADRIAVTGIKVSIPALLMQMYARERYGAAQTFRFDPYTVAMTHGDAMTALLAGSGAISAHFTSPPFHQRERLDPQVRTVLDSNAVLGGPATFTMLSTTGAFHAANRALCAAVLAALEQANAMLAADPMLGAALLQADAGGAGLDAAQLAAVLREPDIRFTTTPENVMRYARFMHAIGSIGQAPADWRALFFAELHDAPGS